jgi:hypothetical protein
MSDPGAVSSGFDKASGISAYYRYYLLPRFSVTDGGTGHEAGLVYERSALDRTMAWMLVLSGGSFATEGRKFPEAVEGSITENQLTLGELGWHQATRRFGDGPRTSYFRSEEGFRIGGGRMTVDPPAQLLDGESIDLPPESLGVLSLTRLNTFGLVLEPTPRFPIEFQLGFGTRYLLALDDLGEHLNFSRLNVLLFAGIRMGLGDNNAERAEANNAAGPSEIAYGLANKLHLWGEQQILYQELMKPSANATAVLEEVFGQGGLSTHGPETADLSLLLTAKGFLASHDGDLFFRSPLWARWLLTAEDLVLGTVNFGQGVEGNPGDASLLSGAYQSYFQAGAKIPHLITQDPLSPGADLLLSTLPAVAGVAIAAGTGTDASAHMAGLGGGGFSTLMARVLDPDPMGSQSIISTTYSIPSLGSIYRGPDGGGSRGGLRIARRLRLLGGSLQLSASLRTPFFDAGEAGKALSPDGGQPDGIYRLPSGNRAEADMVVDLAKGSAGSLEFSAGLHVDQEIMQTTTTFGGGAHAALGGFVALSETIHLGTQLLFYAGGNRQGGYYELPYPTLQLRLYE